MNNMMNIAVIGLGLIGGSFCKALKKYTSYTILGYDIDKTIEQTALDENAIDKVIDESEFSLADITIVALYPFQTIEFITNNADKFKKNAIVIDICGVKKFIVEACSEILYQNQVEFIGTHPMSGREFSGFHYSQADLFQRASFIITPSDKNTEQNLQLIEYLAEKIGFGNIVRATPEKHDANIAYTSQLAHVVSNAYVKSPALFNSDGFSAGSFLDLTRVAKLNEYMWTDLFLCNKEPLINEIDIIINHLKACRNAIETDNKDELISILKEGRERKEKSLAFYAMTEKK